MSGRPAETSEGTISRKSRVGRSSWNLESVVDWFETEGSVFTSLGGRGRPIRMRVLVASQQDNNVIKSVCEYLEQFGFHPFFRPTSYFVRKGFVRTRTAECELLRTLEQLCFLRQCLPLLRTEKRIREVQEAILWLEKRKSLPRRRFRKFECPDLR